MQVHALLRSCSRSSACACASCICVWCFVVSLFRCHTSQCSKHLKCHLARRTCFPSAYLPPCACQLQRCPEQHTHTHTQRYICLSSFKPLAALNALLMLLLLLFERIKIDCSLKYILCTLVVVLVLNAYKMPARQQQSHLSSRAHHPQTCLYVFIF